MTFFGLILHNLWSKKARSLGLAFAVAIAVMAVVTLDVTSNGLEQSAAAIISVGKADFTVVQKGASDTLASTIDRQELAQIRQHAGRGQRGRACWSRPRTSTPTTPSSSRSASTRPTSPPSA